jgi:hypothetical protein
MNRIYKVIWSKVKHQYVVVSELAHRDGKRSSAATTSKAKWRALAAALMLTGSLVAVPYAGYAIDGGTATQSQYIAIGGANKNEPGVQTEKIGGTLFHPIYQYYKEIDGHKYIYTPVGDNNYWVRDGYSIEVEHKKNFDGAESDVNIRAYKNSDSTDDSGLLQSYQTVTSKGNITTGTGYNIQDSNTSMYGGATNQGGVAAEDYYGYNLDLDGSGNYATRVSTGANYNEKYPDQKNNFNQYFKPVTYENGIYKYNDKVVASDDMYVIGGTLGVFVDNNGDIYKGTVYGDSNEVLVNAVDSGEIYTLWGTRLDDPKATIGSMTVEQYDNDRQELKNDVKGVHGDDIKQINLVENQDKNGGTIALNQYGLYDTQLQDYKGNYNVPGTITIRNTENSGDGKDVTIEFTNTDEQGQSHSFFVDAGSKVEANKQGVSSDTTLDTLTINGKTFGLPTGTKYSEGGGIDISRDHKISVDTVENGNLFFNKKGELDSKDYRLINGTEVIGGTEEQPAYGYKVNENGTVELIVQDGTDVNSKKTVTIADVASKSALDDMGKTLEGAVMYDKPGDTYNYSSVTLGNESNKYNNDGTGKPTGGVTLTNVAYADVNGKDTGSNAVNVDLLKDYVNENGGTTYTGGNGISVDNQKDEISVNAGAGLGFSEKANEKGTKELEVKVGSNLEINDQNQVDLKDNITLGAAEGPHIQLNGTPDGENNVVSIVDGNSNELFTIGQDGLVSSDGDVIADADGGKYSLSEVSQFAVRYDKNGNGTINHNSVTLASTDEYMTVKDSAGHVISAAGGTTLKNVAYASGQDGSEAVNVDYLTTQLDKSQSVAANADFYLRNGTESLGTAADGSAITVGSQTTGYKADDNGNIDMIVANENGMEKHVILTDVASKAALDEVTTDVNTGWTATDGTNSIAVNPDNATLAFKGDENVTVSADAANHAINVSLNDDITLGDKNGSHITLNGTTGTFGLVTEGEDSVSHVVNFGTDGATFSKIVSTTSDEGYTTEETFKTVIDGGTVTVSKGDERTTVIDGATITTDKVTGLANTEWSDKIANEVAADKLGAGTGAASIAATQGQLKDVADMAGSAADEAAKHTTIKKGDNNLDIIAGENDNGGLEYTIGLKDTIQLGNGNIIINGENGVISAANAVTIGDTTTLTNGKLIGLANVDWNPEQARTDEDLYNPEQAATQGQLDDLYDSVVGYDVIGGKVDYSSITLGHGSEYKGSAGGGTHIYNVAYASGDYGSEAVNVDYLKDQIDAAKTELSDADKHLATNSGGNPDMADATYAPDENGNVTIKEVDGTGKPTGNEVVISDIASKTELDNVKEDVSDLQEDVGDLNYVDTESGKGNVVTNGDSVTEAIGDLDGAIGDLQDKVEEAHKEAGKHSTVSVGNGLELDTTKATDTAGADYKVSLADDFTLGDVNGEHVTVEGSKGTISATGNISGGSFSTTDGISIGKNEEGKNVVSGLENLDWDATKDYSQSGMAATEAQLQKATEAAVQYERNEDGSVNKGSVIFAGENGTTLNNVAAGEVSATSTQAVNGSQLWQTNQAVINNSNNIQMLSNSVNKLDNRIDRVGAGAAALAALHPLDFDPDAKWDFAAGYGNYRGASAVAMGAYYRPNEDVMLSVGGSMGGGENMVNAGVSLKIGAGSSNVTTSRVAMAKEIKSMRDIVAKQDAQIQKLTAMVNALVGVQTETDTTTMFPDVPENHWAYEAVEAMAKSGLVKGYPDGEFKGDRTMTRYEFAQIVYNAIQAGAEVDARLVEEFKPELEYFHIATVAKDKDGNPTIERVRAN